MGKPFEATVLPRPIEEMDKAEIIDFLNKDNAKKTAEAIAEACLNKELEIRQEVEREIEEAVRQKVAETIGQEVKRAVKIAVDEATERLIESFRIANARYWGACSEKIHPHQISLFNDFEAAADPSAEEPVITDKATRLRGKKKRGKREIDLSGLPVVVIDHDITEGDRGCPECGDEMGEMKVEVTKKLRYVPAHMEVEEHHRHVYICKKCCHKNAKGEEVSAQIVRADMPNGPVAKSVATPSLIAHLMYAKYANGMPLYRIEQDFRRTIGVGIPRVNMCNWVISCSERWLLPLWGLLKDELLQATCLHSDETKVQVLKEPGRSPTSKSYMWLYATGRYEKPVILYEYNPSRSAAIPKAFLGKWNGYLHADGYDVYHGLGPGITVIGCLAHVRRKYTDIIKGIGIKNAEDTMSYEALLKLDAIFHTDGLTKEMDPGKRHEFREENLRPLVEGFYEWAEKSIDAVVPKTALHGAMGYALNQRKYIMNLFLDGRLECSNNFAERINKAFAVCRKNFLFSDTPEGAGASAVVFSIIQTALANRLLPYEYLSWLLTELPNVDVTDNDVLARFLPWSLDVPAVCKNPTANSEYCFPDEPILLPEGADIDVIEKAWDKFDE